MNVQLAIEVGTGVAVLVRCFVNKKNMEAEIVDRLGNGFSRAPFATVVVISISHMVSLTPCTVVELQNGNYPVAP